MLIYWSMFIVPAILSLQEPPTGIRRMGGGVLGVILFIWVIMAFREIGGDYPTYLKMFEMADGRSLADTIDMGDRAYMFLNWASSTLGLGIYGVNAACATIFLGGLYKFVQDEPKPILTLTIAVSYLVVVVAIGYTRQGTAIGLILLMISQIRRYRPVSAAVCIALAILFHSSAVIALPLLYFALVARTRVMRIIIRFVVTAACGYAIYVFFNAQADIFYKNYILSDRYSSDGAVLRSISNASAGAIFLLYRKKWKELFDDARIWTAFAILAVFSVPGAVVASTAVDRMGLYLIPLQLAAFGRLPLLANLDKKLVLFSVLGVYMMSFIIWLHFGQFAGELWLPYKSVLFGTIS